MLDHQHQLLGEKAAAHGYHHAPARFELVDERRGDVVAGGGDDTVGDVDPNVDGERFGWGESLRLPACWPII